MNTLLIGQRAPDARVYVCSRCGYHTAMLKDEIAVMCAHCKKQSTWHATVHQILLKTKNVAQEVEKRSSMTDHASDAITNWCGSFSFVYLHLLWFGMWIFYNLFAKPFDPYPFGLLTMIVSLEAIMLATFVLMSQRREGQISDLRAELDYHVNLKSEKIINEVKAMLADLIEKQDIVHSRKK